MGSRKIGVGKNGENADFQPVTCYISVTIEDRHVNGEA